MIESIALLLKKFHILNEKPPDDLLTRNHGVTLSSGGNGNRSFRNKRGSYPPF